MNHDTYTKTDVDFRRGHNKSRGDRDSRFVSISRPIWLIYVGLRTIYVKSTVHVKPYEFGIKLPFLGVGKK